MSPTWSAGSSREVGAEQHGDGPDGNAGRGGPWFWSLVLCVSAVAIGVVIGWRGIELGTVLASLVAVIGFAWRQQRSPDRRQMVVALIALPAAVGAWWLTDGYQHTRAVDVFAHTTLSDAQTLTVRTYQPVAVRVDEPASKENLALTFDARDTTPNVASCVDVSQLRFTGTNLRRPTASVPLNPNGPTEAVLGIDASASRISLQLEMVGADEACEVELELKGAEFR